MPKPNRAPDLIFEPDATPEEVFAAIQGLIAKNKAKAGKQPKVKDEEPPDEK